MMPAISGKCARLLALPATLPRRWLGMPPRTAATPLSQCLGDCAHCFSKAGQRRTRYVIENTRSHTAQVYRVGPLQGLQPLRCEDDVDASRVFGATPLDDQTVSDELVDQADRKSTRL